MMIKDMPHDEKLDLFNRNMKIAYPDGHGLDDSYISYAELTMFDNEDICMECTTNQPTLYRSTSSMVITHPDFYEFKKKIFKAVCGHGAAITETD
jgi:hypothetical protein